MIACIRRCNEMDILSLCHTDDLLSHPFEITLVTCIYNISMPEPDYTYFITVTLYEQHHVSCHQRRDCWFMCFCCLTTKEIPKLHLLSVSQGYPPMTGGFSPQRTGDAESVSVS